MRIDFKVDLRPFLQSIDHMKSTKVPAATSTAINRTLMDAEQAVVAEIRKDFDSPTNFTLRSLGKRWSNKRSLVGYLEVEQAGNKGFPPTKVLAHHVYGGTRSYKRFERALQARGLLPPNMMVVPTAAAPKDMHGNVPAGFIVKVMAYIQAFGEQGYTANMTAVSRGRKKLDRAGLSYFVGRPTSGGSPGIYERKKTAFGGAIRPIFLFVDAYTYQKRLPFHEIVEQTVRMRFAGHFKAALEQQARARA